MARELLDIGAIVADNLIAGDRFPLSVKGVTLAAGQGKLARGTVLGIVTSDGKAKVVDSSKSDGTQNPDCILAEEIDTTGAAVSAVAYNAGFFIRNALVFGGADTYAKHELEMRRLGIHLSASLDEKGAEK